MSEKPMGQMIGGSIGVGTWVAIAIVAAIAIAMICYLLLSRRVWNGKNAKCTKCNKTFEVTNADYLFSIGPFKYLKCPACGKWHFSQTKKHTNDDR